MANDALYRRVAELHIANINQGFLATLGVGFLAQMYRAIDEGQGSALLVAKEGDHIIGFVAAGCGMRPIYLRMLWRWPQLFAALLPALLSPRRVWRILEILRYSSNGSARGASALPEAELLSIAVDAGVRGQGHADALYRSLCARLTSHDVLAFKIVVGAALAPAHRFYLRMGAEPVARTEVHRGEISTVYVQQIPLGKAKQPDKSEHVCRLTNEES